MGEYDGSESACQERIAVPLVDFPVPLIKEKIVGAIQPVPLGRIQERFAE